MSCFQSLSTVFSSKMSELNINDLPGEILEKVFRYLDGSSMKNATLTCKLWNNLVEFACRWSLSLTYCEDKVDVPDSEQKMNFILTTNRRFATFTIAERRFGETSQIIEIFRRHGFSVVNLHLYECHIDSLVALAELLNLTPNLKHAVMEMITLEDARPYTLRRMQPWENAGDVRLDQVLPDLKKLKSLELLASDARIIKCFQKAQLTTITIGEMEIYGLLIDFLSSQKMLTSMNADFDTLSELGELKAPIQCRLTQLAILHSFNGESSDNYLRFIKSQAENLKELEIGWHVKRNICESIMAQNLSKLESLSIDSRLIGCVKFPNIKKLRVRGLDDKIDWNEFTKIHSRLVELTIKRIYNNVLTSDDIEQIATNVDLQSIRLGAGFVADDRFSEILRAKCANLKVLELHRSCISQCVLPHGLRQDVEFNVF